MLHHSSSNSRDHNESETPSGSRSGVWDRMLLPFIGSCLPKTWLIWSALLTWLINIINEYGKRIFSIMLALILPASILTLRFSATWALFQLIFDCSLAVGINNYWYWMSAGTWTVNSYACTYWARPHQRWCERAETPGHKVPVHWSAPYSYLGRVLRQTSLMHVQVQ